MPIETKVFSVLTTSTIITALVSTANINPEHRNQDDALPAIDFQRGEGERINTLSGYSNLENPHYIVNVYTSDIDSRRIISAAIITAMSSSTLFSATLPTSPIDDFDDELKQYTRTLDFSIWNRE